jgi:hypothetical protein
MSNYEFQKLCDKIFRIDANVRFVGVIDKMGSLVAGGMRQGIKSMEDIEDSQKLYVEFALRSVMREEFDKEFGKTIYSFSERERIKFTSFPYQDHLILVSIEKGKPHDKILENILRILS